MKIDQKKAGIILTYLAQATHIVIGLVYTPIMLRLLGQSEYGLYQLVYSVVAYLSLLSFGFSSSYMRFYARFKSKNDEHKVAGLNGMFLLIFLVIAAICACCGIVMVHHIELIFSDGLSSEEYKIARILMALMVVNLCLTFPNSVFDAFTSSKEKFVFQKLLLLAQNVLNPFLTLPLLILGYGSIGMVAATTFLTLTKLALNVHYCIRKLNVKFSFNQFDLNLLKEMWFFTFFIFINMIVDQINWSVDKFLLGRISGTVAVAVYGVASQLNTMYLQLSTAVSSVFIPRVNMIVAKSNDNSELSDLFPKTGRIQFIILSLVTMGFIFIGREFIALWAGNDYGEAYYVALLLMIPATIPLIQNLGVEIQRAKNMHKARSVVYLFIAIMNVFISIPFIKLWGPSGAALGTAVSLLVGNGFFMNWYYQKRIGLDMFRFWKEILKLIPALAVPFIFGVILLHMGIFNSVLKLLLGTGIYTGVFCISMWFFGLNTYEKQLITRAVSKMLKKCSNHG